MGLALHLWLPSDDFSLVYPSTLSGFLLLSLYLAGFLVLLFVRRRDFGRMRWPQWVPFLAALIVLLLFRGAFVLSRTPVGLSLAASPSFLPSLPALSLLALVVVTAASIWLGGAPGIVLGLVAGIIRVGFYGHPLNDAFTFVAWAATVTYLVHQPYRGLLFDLLRHPLGALQVAVLSALLVLSLNRLSESLPQGLVVALDHARMPLRSAWLVWWVSSLLQGLFFGLLFLLRPALRPPQRADLAFVTQRYLRARFMLMIIPPLLLGLLISVLAVTSRGVGLARDQAVQEMGRSATNASESVQNFYYTGANLLVTFVADPALLDPALSEEILEVSRQVVPFFQEFLLTDATGTLVTVVPADTPQVDQNFTEEEALMVEQALDFGIAQQTHLVVLPSGERRLTFIQPVFNAVETEIEGVLLGRVDLDINPVLQRALDALQLTRGVGTGFILDERGLIIAHPEESYILRPWTSTVDPIAVHPVAVGVAYEDVGPEGDRLLTHVRTVDGAPATLVMQLPFSVVLETATAISNPMLVVQLSTSLVLLFLIPFLAARVTQPLQTLAQAARHIARGDLDVPVHISGADEVGQLGAAFEQMRLRLQARLTDLSLLLNVAQSVSATLQLDEGVPLILEGALAETGAATARFVLLRNGTNRPQQVFSVGMAHASFPGLDRVFAAALYRRRDAVVNPDLHRDQATPILVGPLQSFAAFPVRTHNRTVAALWVGAMERDAFDEAKINFLSTLASQAAVLVENARLFQAAEGGRQRLAAILASTTDAIFVTDQDQRLLLINPAARRVLSLTEAVYGKSIRSLDLPVPLEEALLRFEEGDQQGPLPAIEVPLEDGRTFYASVAPITPVQGQEGGGRVVVMRDVTHFKELDEMKSDFVATVSHDLRAPLTFIRGYASMLMMVGELNDKQQEYLERILDGIEQMSALIGDLLNLRRIEAGVGIKREPTSIGLVLVEAVDNMRARATTKEISLRLEPADGAPVVTGDRTLLRQAFSNLVDNAIKYTPTGGEVSVGLEINHPEQHVIVHVKDTGIGIAPEDRVRLFEKFYRIKRRETGGVSGTGLGLALVKSIVERHDGHVWVESEMDRGSTFYVALPLRSEEEEAA
jgi:PAS domain S-box-containing protein